MTLILTACRRRRSRSRPRSHRGVYPEFDEDEEPLEARTMLMTNSEALHSLYGEISTERDGDLTHQCIQTNLADVICGGECDTCMNISILLVIQEQSLFRIKRKSFNQFPVSSLDK